MQLIVDPAGQIRTIYGEEIDLATLGRASVFRASFVEPDRAGPWHARSTDLALAVTAATGGAGQSDGMDTVAETAKKERKEGERMSFFVGLLLFVVLVGRLDDMSVRLVPHRTEALTLLAEAVDRSPTLDRAHLYKGHVHKALGQNADAQGEYEKAVECNPGCTEALRELSILTWAARLAQSRPS